MSTIDEVIERLDETEKQAGEVLRQLEDAESLHKSLAETRNGLETVARDVHGLITATRKGLDTLAEAVTGFKTATETIQRSDPGAITAALKSMEDQIAAIAGEMPAIGQMKAEITEVKGTAAQAISANEERTRAMIEYAISANEERTREMIEHAIEELSGQSLMDRVLGRRRSTGGRRGPDHRAGTGTKP